MSIDHNPKNPVQSRDLTNQLIEQGVAIVETILKMTLGPKHDTEPKNPPLPDAGYPYPKEEDCTEPF